MDWPSYKEIAAIVVCAAVIWIFVDLLVGGSDLDNGGGDP